MFKCKRILFLISILFCTYACELYAQQRANFQNRGAQYLIGKEDELLIKVNIWGFVRMPGQYLVPSDTDLISLISYAGGPVEGAQTKKVRLVRTTEFTPDGKNREDNEKIYHYNVKKFLETGDMSLNPQLLPNDTIMISGSTGHFVTKLFQYIALITPLLQAWYWYQVANR